MNRSSSNEPSAGRTELPGGALVPTAAGAPPAGTARVHWIGHYGDQSHPSGLNARLAAGEPGLVVVDARYPEAFAREHIPGAINLYARALDDKAAAGLNREAEFVVYCWNESCRASAMATERLLKLGFRARELHGGLQRWKSEGYPTVRG